MSGGGLKPINAVKAETLQELFYYLFPAYVMATTVTKPIKKLEGEEEP